MTRQADHSVRVRLAAFAPLLLILPLMLSGCALQADWDGSKKLNTEECRLAAQLFHTAADGEVEEIIASPEDSDAADAADVSINVLSAPELAEALRPYVIDELMPALDTFATPMAASDEPGVVVARRDAAEEARTQLQEWATLVCGPQVGRAPNDGLGAADGTSTETALPGLAEMQVMRTGESSSAVTIVTGAIDPIQAVNICEEARATDAASRIEVKDPDGFPLALAESGAPCDLDPGLLEGLDVNPEEAK